MKTSYFPAALAAVVLMTAAPLQSSTAAEPDTPTGNRPERLEWMHRHRYWMDLALTIATVSWLR